MRLSLTVIVAAAALTIGAAHAAPAFGTSSHRVGGSSSEPVKKGDALSIFEALFAVLGFDVAASVEPVADETMNRRDGKAKQCEQAKKAEVAKAETKNEAEGASSRGKSRTGEPVYLAF
jgi:hypothetical protein